MSKVRWGFLGAGDIARTALAPAVHAADTALLEAVGAREQARARQLEPRTAYPSYEQVLADPRVEAVYISLPNDAHVPWALRAVAAGKAVLCEKPLGLTAAEVDELRARAHAAGVLVAEASWYRWHPRIGEVERLVRGGDLGAPEHVVARFATRLRVGPTNYRFSVAHGGGALYDLGCYAISAALWSFGNAVPEKVAARRRVGPTGVDLETEAEMAWPSGAARIACAFGVPDAQDLVVRCADGGVEVPDEPFTLLDRPADLVITDRRGRRTVSFPPVNPYRLMVEAFSGALRGGGQWVLPLAQSRACAATVDAVMAASARP